MRGAIDANQEAGPALRRFATGLRRRFVLGHGLGAGLRAGAWLTLSLLGVAWLAPSVLDPCIVAAAVVVTLSVTIGVVRARWRSRRLLASLQRDGGGDVAADQLFHDELLTWLEWDRKASSAPASARRAGMIRWLEADVYERLQPRRQGAQRAMLRVGLGRWRLLAVVFMAVALAWLLGLWFQPPWRGVVGGAPAEPTSTEAREDGGGVEPDEQDEAQKTPREPGAEAGSPVEREVPEAPQPLAPVIPEGDDPEPEEPVAEEPPLVEAPDDRRFILPDFIGDGPTRRERMHVAELEQPSAGGGARADRLPAGGAERPRPSPAPAVEFERAAEKAARSRHVPDRERSMVRRFFEELQKRGRR